MNVHDSQKLMKILADDYSTADSPGEADLVIVSIIVIDDIRVVA